MGSFLNVIIYRLPLKRSIVSPPSACTACQSHIKWFDNIPVLSWLILRGKCRECKSPISPRYPLVEFGTALLFGGVAWKFLPTSTTYKDISTLIAFLYLASISVALAMIDVDTHTLPNRIVLPSYFIGSFLLGVSVLASRDYVALERSVIGACILWFFYVILALAYPGGMGFGDVKIAGVVGLFLGFIGWKALIVGTSAAFVLGGLYAVLLLLLRKVDRKSGIPFGPWIFFGAWVGIFWGPQIASRYLSLVGLGNSL